ncbi:molybdenum cofactor biosynthesis protein MoaE [Chloroflexota bacterium]
MESAINVIEVTKKPISPELVVNKVKTDGSGCMVTYVGLIRGFSQGKQVLSVEYKDSKGTAENELQKIASEIGQKWQINNLAICHRIGKLKVGDINLVVAVASAHRQEGFAACQYAIDQFKQKLPTQKRETYTDSSVLVEEK